MNKCKICGKKFSVSSCKQGYTSWCSRACYQKHYLLAYPERVKKQRKSVWRNRKSDFSCCICGFSSALDFCHIKPRREGGRVNKDNIAILCPNHHRLFDANLLSRKELLLVKPIKNNAQTK